MNLKNNIKSHLLERINNPASESWNEKIEFLYNQQLETWQMARNRYHQFQSIKKRTIQFPNFKIDLQHNPSRARSTCADVSTKAIEKRPCFLCTTNLPVEQKGFMILKKYLLLINPFPIFEKHLTISDIEHTPQQLKNRIIDMLSIAKALSDFTIFYNGAQCGASAPDHFHFQAAQKGIMPIDLEIGGLKISQGKTLFKNNDITITQIENYYRNVIIIESTKPELVDNYFSIATKQLPINAQSGESMMNVLANYKQNIFRLTLFPRAAQRPLCYYSQGSERILVSPASVELGGIVITPREEDYQKINENDLVNIYKEVSFQFDFQF